MLESLKLELIRRRDAALRVSGENAGLREVLASDERYEDVEDLLARNDSPWSISPDLARLLSRAVISLGLSNVLEFGAGLSSLVLATALSHLPRGRLTSVEQNLSWCRDHWRRVGEIENVDSRIVESRPRLCLNGVGLCYVFREAAGVIAARAPYDLVLVDAPQGFYGRDGVLAMVHRRLAPEALVVLDDAGRSSERWALFRNLVGVPAYRLLFYDGGFGGRGCAVLSSDSRQRSRPSLLGVSTSVIQVVRYARGRRRAEISGWT